MNRTQYFTYIESKLNFLAFRINIKGKLNILDLHLHSENFYLHFLNKLYEFELSNLNQTLQNFEAIDLIDHTNKIIIQISATNTKTKIESSLKKSIIKKYPAYSFKFISISKDASELRKSTFDNPHKINFNPSTDIIDTASILNAILSLSVDKQKEIYQFIKDELAEDIDIVKLDSNLAVIINILSKENLNDLNSSITINSFEIERKISFNKLNAAKYIIEDYKIHYNRLDKKYKEFDTQGVNKSNSILSLIRNEYIKNLTIKTADELFYLIHDNILEIIIQSANYVPLPIDELELTVHIIIVDAFIRCKIFENPESYNHVIT